MITPADAIPYLLRVDQITSEQLLQERTEVTQSNRRNANLNIAIGRDGGYFLKQGNSDNGIGTVRHEAMAYELLAANANDALRRHLPICFGYDRRERVLVLQSLLRPIDLQAYYGRRGRFPRAITRDMGRALGWLHRLNKTELTETPGSLQAARPAVLMFTRPPIDILDSISAGGLELLKLIQQNKPFEVMFDRLNACWESDTLIHGDAGLANFVSHLPHANACRRQVKLVDWEFCTWGDPHWDLGALFASYLHLWLCSIPITGSQNEHQLARSATVPLSRVQAAIREVWSAYVSVLNDRAQSCDESVSFGIATSPLPDAMRPTFPASGRGGRWLCSTAKSMPPLPLGEVEPQAREREPINETEPFRGIAIGDLDDRSTAAGVSLVTATQYAAVNLLNIAYSLSESQTELTAHIRAIVQLSHNIAVRPAEAGRDLLGVSRNV